MGEPAKGRCALAPCEECDDQRVFKTREPDQEGSGGEMNEEENAEHSSDRIRVYVDDRTTQGRKALEYLVQNQIVFSTIPTAGSVPVAITGAARYIGFEQIKVLVDELTNRRVERWCNIFYQEQGGA
jgi:hypothetical protein